MFCKADTISPVKRDHIAKNASTLRKTKEEVIAHHGGALALDSMIVAPVKETTSSTYDYDIDTILGKWIDNLKDMEPTPRKMKWYQAIRSAMPSSQKKH